MPIEYHDLHTGSATDFWIRFVLSTLTTWRVSHLLAAEDGPWEILARLRMRIESYGFGKLLDCFGCVSIWVAAPLSLFLSRALPDIFLCWLALSSAAFLLERTGPQPLLIEAQQNEESEVPHGLLR